MIFDIINDDKINIVIEESNAKAYISNAVKVIKSKNI